MHVDSPWPFDARGRTAECDDANYVRTLIENVLFTSPGERVNRPEFGCGLKQLVFMPNSDALASATQQLVHGSLHRWLEEVIAVERVEVQAVDSSLVVTVVYVRRDTGERHEDVFSRPVPV